MSSPAKVIEDAEWGDMDWGGLDEVKPVEKPAAAPAVARVMEAPVEEPAPPAEASHVVEAPPPPPPPAAKVEPAAPAAPVAAPPPRSSAAVVFAPDSKALLVLTDGRGGETTVEITSGFTVGRVGGNSLVIKDMHVSSHHARFECDPDGVFEVVDLNSSGGTFVNGARVAREPLREGDQILFATVAATIRYVAGLQCAADSMMGGTLVAGKEELARQLQAAKASARQEASLSLTLPDGEVVRHALDRDMSLGRQEDNDIVIQDRHVSSRHARLLRVSGGAFELVDLQSTCGTFVNGHQITSQVLKEGDRVRFGMVEGVFHTGAGRQEAAQPAPAERKLPEPRPAMPHGGWPPGIPRRPDH